MLARCEQLGLTAEQYPKTNVLPWLPVTGPVGSRQAIEAYIQKSYKQLFNAQLASFLPNLVAATTENRQICAAFGYTDAQQDTLFLEGYLDTPIEQLLSARLGRNVSRDRIVEVGNLSIAQCADSSNMLHGIASYLKALGFEWIVCTATRYLRVLFLRSGTKPVALTRAEACRVTQGGGTDWGNYYQTGAEILAGNIELSLEMIRHRFTASKASQKMPDPVNFFPARACTDL